MNAISQGVIRSILTMILLKGVLTTGLAQVASYDFNENVEDQAGGHHATIFGTPTFENGEYISFTPGQYLSLPLSLSEAIDVSESWQFEFRFKVEGDWEATEGEEHQVIIASKVSSRYLGGFAITAREWLGQLQLITTFGDGITYPPYGCATCGPHEGPSEGKADWVIDIDSGIWYDVKIKFYYDSDRPYIQYEVNGTIFISYWNPQDPQADPEGFRQTINQQQIWVGSDEENNAYIFRTERPKMDLQLNHLSFWSPVPQGDPGKVGSVLQSLVEDMQLKFGGEGSVDDGLTEAQIDSLRQVFIGYWDDQAYEENTAIIWEYINTYAAFHEPIFNQWINIEAPQNFAPLEAIQFIMEQWILDNRYGPETVHEMEGLIFEDHELFPGKVSHLAPRITDKTFTVNGDYQTNPGFYNNGQEQVIRPSGYYVPPGELVTITVPDEVIGKGLSLFAGAHNVNLSTTYNEFRRFPRIMTTYQLDEKTITVSNPFGGGIYIKVPDGSAYGPLEFGISGAIKAPYYSDVEGFSHSLEAFNADLANQYVPWVDIESKNMMATITTGMAKTIEDMDSVFSFWNKAFDGVNIALGRPVKRFRAEYFLIDRQNHFRGTAMPASYPMPFERYEEPYGASITMPLEVESGRDWYNDPSDDNFFMIIMHEQGHLHNMPTLPWEVESNVNLLATAALSHAMGESIDSAFVYSIDQQLNLDQAAMDWVLVDNFHQRSRIGYMEETEENGELEQRYQSRGFAKYVDIANLFGLEALGSTYKPFYERRTKDPSWDPYALQDDEYIEAASYTLGFNMAPHFEFWGIIPSEELVERLSDMPTSNVIKDRLIHFRSLVPANNDEFQELHRIMTGKLQWFSLVPYDEWKTTYDEARAQRITDRIDEILNKYYDINALDYNQNPVITGTTDALYAYQHSSLTLELSHFLVEDADNNYPDDFTLGVAEGNHYTVSGTTITPDFDFLGELKVSVTVNDGQEDSLPFEATVEVVIENERPVISGLAGPISIDEDSPLTLTLDHFLVQDDDHTYPDDFTLEVSEGDHYALSGTTITPDTDFNGPLWLTAIISDGIQDSKPFTFDIEVIAVNDPPAVLGPARLFVIQEEETMHFRADYFVVTDPDHAPGEYSIEILEGENYTFDYNSVTPAKDYHGQLTIAMLANDWTDKGDPFEFKIEVLPVNDLPVIDGLVSTLSTEVDQPIALSLSDFKVTDPDHAYPDDFTLTVLAGTNYSVSATTVTPNPSFSGELLVPVTVNDGMDESAHYLASINVHPPNDRPEITGTTGEFTTPEDTPLTLALSDFVVEDSDHTYPDGFTLRIHDGENYSIAAEGSTGITPDLNFAGTLHVQVSVNDGVEESEPYLAEVTVTPVNDQPVVTEAVETFATLEDTPITLSLTDFSVNDPDNTYPDDFGLRILEGDHYSASGSTITPAQDFNGSLAASIIVNDGLADSEAFSVLIEVGTVNDVPVITGPVSVLSTEVDEPINLSLSDFQVSDPDHAYPDEFTLTVLEGNNYTVSATTVTPDPSFTGELSVPVTVNDGIDESAQYLATIHVHLPNAQPEITGITSELTTQEDTPLTLSLSDFVVEDSDHDYPNDFTLQPLPGKHYTLEGNTIIPETNFFGNLEVPVKVNDGVEDSEEFPATITVEAVNDPPSIQSPVQPVQIREEEARHFTPEDFIIEDPDDEPGNHFIEFLEGENYFVTQGNTITPHRDYHGVLQLVMVANDFKDYGEHFEWSIEVLPVNDAPVINGVLGLLSTPVNEPFSLSVSNFNIYDPDDEALLLTVMEGDNYTLSERTLTPATDFIGDLTVPVKVSDGELESEIYTATISVHSPNNRPVITGQVNALTTEEGMPIRLSLSDLMVEDSDNNYPDDFTLHLFDGDNYFVAGDGTIGIVPEHDFSGELSVAVAVDDGTSQSEIFLLRVVVTPVNDIPVITGIHETFAIHEDESVTLSLDMFEVRDSDNDFPDDFSLTVIEGANYTVSGTTVSPEANFGGTLSVPVTVNDGHSDSQPFLVSIDVTKDNDIPAITGQSRALSTAEDTPLTFSLSDLVVEDNDNDYPGDFSLQLFAGEHYSLSADGSHIITPEANYVGELKIPVAVDDGLAQSEQFFVIVEVTAVNDPPVILGLTAALSTPEDESISIELADLEVQDPDHDFPDNFSLQLSEGENYSFSITTVSPAANFAGSLRVPVTVSDGLATSEPFEVTIEVLPVNDVPEITDQVNLLTTEAETPLTLALTDFSVNDPDHDYPAGFSLTVFKGENYSLEGHTITPIPDFIGTLSVPVMVNDGQADSETFTASVNVSPVLGLENSWVKKHFSVYPNPAKDYLHLIKDQDIAVYEVRLLSPKGDVLLYESGIRKRAYQLLLGHLDDGLYILQVDAPGGRGTFKVLKH